MRAEGAVAELVVVVASPAPGGAGCGQHARMCSPEADRRFRDWLVVKGARWSGVVSARDGGCARQGKGQCAKERATRELRTHAAPWQEEGRIYGTTTPGGPR